MEKNVGGTDKTIRIVAGIVIIVLGLIFRSWWGLIGVVILITGLVGFCGIYKLFGFSTCKSGISVKIEKQ
ncbi:MAG TPA: DUF2892 domain-containing protein [Firmicutes bacterium]|nr:DUF2892 domain-containing protein [Bacillota bacterium]